MNEKKPKPSLQRYINGVSKKLAYNFVISNYCRIFAPTKKQVSSKGTLTYSKQETTHNDMCVTYDEEKGVFMFDFEHDGQEDLMSLTGSGYQVEAFGKCFYYGYEFADEIPSNIRSEFIKFVKFTYDIPSHTELTQFVQRAIDRLNDKINLYNYDLVVMPQSSSQLNRYMLRYIYRFAQPELQYMELVKSLPSAISFDIEAYSKQHLDDVLENGQPRYNPKQKEEARASIAAMMDLIHQKDYFTIAKDVKKNKLRPYIEKFLMFQSKEDERLCSSIRNNNVLIVDDITTSGSTLNEIMRTLRLLNENNEITIFSLIGRKDLLVEK